MFYQCFNFIYTCYHIEYFKIYFTFNISFLSEHVFPEISEQQHFNLYYIYLD